MTSSIVHVKGEWTKLLVITDHESIIEKIEERLIEWREIIEKDTKLSEIEIPKCIKADFTEKDLTNAIENNLSKGSSFVMIPTKYDEKEKQLMRKIKHALKRYGNYWPLEKFTTTAIKRLILEINHQARGINYKCPNHDIFDGKHIFGHVTKFGRKVVYCHNGGNQPHIIIEGHARKFKDAIESMLKPLNIIEIQELKRIFVTVSSDEIQLNTLEKMQEYTCNKYNLPQDILTIVSLKADISIDAKIGCLPDSDIYKYLDYLQNIDPLRESEENKSALPHTIELLKTKRALFNQAKANI